MTLKTGVMDAENVALIKAINKIFTINMISVTVWVSKINSLVKMKAKKSTQGKSQKAGRRHTYGQHSQYQTKTE